MKLQAIYFSEKGEYVSGELREDMAVDSVVHGASSQGLLYPYFAIIRNLGEIQPSQRIVKVPLRCKHWKGQTVCKVSEWIIQQPEFYKDILLSEIE